MFKLFKKDKIQKRITASEVRIQRNEKTLNQKIPEIELKTNVKRNLAKNNIVIEEISKLKKHLDSKMISQDKRETSKLKVIAEITRHNMEINKDNLAVQKEALEEQKKAEYNRKHQYKASLKAAAAKVKEKSRTVIQKVKDKPKGGMLLMISKLLAAGYLIKTLWPLIKKKLWPFIKDKIFPFIQKHFKTILGTLGIAKLLANPLKTIKSLFSMGAGLFKTLGKYVGKIGAFTVKGMFKLIKGVGKLAYEGVSELASMGKEGLEKAWNKGKELAGKGIGKVTELAKDGLIKIKDTVSAKVGPIVGKITDKVKEGLSSTVSALKEGSGKLFEKMGIGFGESTGKLAAFKENMSEKFSGMGEKLSGVSSKVKQIGSSLLEKGIGGAVKIGKGIGGVLKVLKPLAKIVPFLGLIVTVWDLLETFFPNFTKEIKNMFSVEKIAELGKSIWGTVKAGVVKIGDWVADKFRGIGQFFEDMLRANPLVPDVVTDMIFGKTAKAQAAEAQEKDFKGRASKMEADGMWTDDMGYNTLNTDQVQIGLEKGTVTLKDLLAMKENASLDSDSESKLDELIQLSKDKEKATQEFKLPKANESMLGKAANDSDNPIATLVKASKNQFILGGYTGEGKSDEVAGLVHYNEFVLSESMLKDITDAKTEGDKTALVKKAAEGRGKDAEDAIFKLLERSKSSGYAVTINGVSVVLTNAQKEQYDKIAQTTEDEYNAMAKEEFVKQVASGEFKDVNANKVSYKAKNTKAVSGDKKPLKTEMRTVSTDSGILNESGTTFSPEPIKVKASTPSEQEEKEITSVDDIKEGDVFKGTKIKNLNPDVKHNLLAMGYEYKEEFGQKLQLNSTGRSVQEQTKLYKEMLKKNHGKSDGSVAVPGGSMHNYGLAVDAQSNQLAIAESSGIMGKYGFHRNVYKSDGKLETWHMEPNSLTQQDRKNVRAAGKKAGKKGLNVDKLVTEGKFTKGKIEKINADGFKLGSTIVKETKGEGISSLVEPANDSSIKGEPKAEVRETPEIAAKKVFSDTAAGQGMKEEYNKRFDILPSRIEQYENIAKSLTGLSDKPSKERLTNLKDKINKLKTLETNLEKDEYETTVKDEELIEDINNDKDGDGEVSSYEKAGAVLHNVDTNALDMFQQTMMALGATNNNGSLIETLADKKENAKAESMPRELSNSLRRAPKQTETPSLVEQGESKQKVGDFTKSETTAEIISSSTDKDDRKFYISEPGETMAQIAKNQNLSLVDLSNMNPQVDDIDKIFAGTKLFVEKKKAKAIPIKQDEQSSLSAELPKEEEKAENQVQESKIETGLAKQEDDKSLADIVKPVKGFKPGVQLKQEEDFEKRFDLLDSRIESYTVVSEGLKGKKDKDSVEKKEKIDGQIKKLKEIKAKLDKYPEMDEIDKEINASQIELNKINKEKNSNASLLKELEGKTDGESNKKREKLELEKKVLDSKATLHQTKIDGRKDAIAELGGRTTDEENNLGLDLKFDTNGDGDMSDMETAKMGLKKADEGFLGGFQDMIMELGFVGEDGSLVETLADKKARGEKVKGSASLDFTSKDFGNMTDAIAGSSMGKGIGSIVSSVKSDGIGNTVKKGFNKTKDAAKNGLSSVKDKSVGMFDKLKGLVGNTDKKEVKETRDAVEAQVANQTQPDFGLSANQTNPEIIKKSATAKSTGKISVAPKRETPVELDNKTKKLAASSVTPKPVPAPKVEKAPAPVVVQVPAPAPTANINLHGSAFNELETAYLGRLV